MKTNSITPTNFRCGFRYELTRETKSHLKKMCEGLPSSLKYQRISQIDNDINSMTDIANVMLRTRLLSSEVMVKDIIPNDEIIYISCEERCEEGRQPYLVAVIDDAEELISSNVKKMQRISSMSYELLISELAKNLLNYSRNFVEHIDINGDRLAKNLKAHFDKYNYNRIDFDEKIKEWFSE